MAELTEQKQQQKAMWAMGDYPSVAERIAKAGTDAVAAAGVSDGDVVLDVACGSGNATIPAAKTGAKVTGLDLTPVLLEAGEANAAEAGVEIEWIEGDAEQLPFDDATFDEVISVFGCMFAPDQKKAASEIARVLKPGGHIGICAWTPEGNVGRMFITTASHMPPPPDGFQPPVLWGSEDHVRELFADTGVELELARTTLDFIGDTPDAFRDESMRDLPPLAAARTVLEPQGKWEALRDDLLTFYDEANEADDGSYRQAAEYLVTSGKKG